MCLFRPIQPNLAYKTIAFFQTKRKLKQSNSLSACVLPHSKPLCDPEMTLFTNHIDQNTHKISQKKLLGVASLATGLQFGWAQSSLLTPYVQELGIPHAWASIIWLCGPLSGLVVQPLVGHMSDRCTSKFGRRRPFIVVQVILIILAVVVIGHSADIGSLLGDNGVSKSRAIVAFFIGFWLFDLANNSTLGSSRALLADLTGK